MTRVPANIPRPDRDPPIGRIDRQSIVSDLRDVLRRWLKVPELTDLADVKRLSLKPGDILLYLIPGILTGHQAADIRKQLSALFPERKIIVLDKGADFEIVTPPPPSSRND